MSYNYDELVTKISVNRQKFYHRNSDDHQEGDLASLSTSTSTSTPLDHLQTAVETFETLSTSCPMTPLLWMQYAYDTSNLIKLLAEQGTIASSSGGHEDEDDKKDNSTALAATNAAALETRIQMLELALNEFPGCAILHVHYLELLSSLLERPAKNSRDEAFYVGGGDGDKDDIFDETYQQTLERYQQALDTAIMQIGQGSHRNEGGLIARIYRRQVDLIPLKAKATQQASSTLQIDEEAVVQSFVARAMTPMGDANSCLSNEYESFCQKHKIPVNVVALKEIEAGRRFESKVFFSLITLEDSVDAAMNQDGISPSDQIDLSLDTTLDWEGILQKSDKTCWMGFGGQQTAQAFTRYAQACVRFRPPDLPQKNTRPDSNDDVDNLDGEDDRMNIDDEIQDHDNPFLNVQTRIRSMASDVFERGVAECPTVESLWLSYLRHLSYQISNRKREENMKELTSALSKAKSVVDRAVRNCPYSVQLFQHKIRIMLIQANTGQIVLDPEEVMKVVTDEALGSQFITSPDAALDLSLTVLDVVRKRILAILATEAGVFTTDESDTQTKQKRQDDQIDEKIFLDYDGAEEIKFSVPPSLESASKDIDEGAMQEIEDLASDFHELFDEIDTLMRKKFTKFTEGRSRLWTDRAVTESMLLGPLMGSTDVDATTFMQSEQRLEEVIRCFEKATKAHMPTNPNLFLSYIHTFVGSFSIISSPLGVLSKLRQTRFLYQKGLKAIGRSKKKSTQPVDVSAHELEYNTAIRRFCHEYMEFERLFGSERSYGSASKEIHRKLSRVVQEVRNEKSSDYPRSTDELLSNTNRTLNKRNLESLQNDNKEGRPTKKTRMPAEEEVVVDSSSDNAAEASREKNLKTSKTPKEFKIEVGKLEYPAHPYTIRVSFLSPQTEEMDLVDSFRPKCGAVVHAKVMREKSSHHDPHHKPKSKGWGLVQFEERESVEKALALSGQIGIHDKVIKVERSHVAAVSLVPPGMHRVNPKGLGKSTKKNMMRKRQQNDHPENEDDGKAGDNGNSDEVLHGGEKSDPAEENAEKSTATKTSRLNILAFRPRGVSSIAKKPKAKISFSSKTTEKN